VSTKGPGLVGKCRLCRYPVWLTDGVWIHDGGISARMAHVFAESMGRFNEALRAAQTQDDYALAGPSKGGGA